MEYQRIDKIICNEIDRVKDSTDLVCTEKLAAIFSLERVRGKMAPRPHPVFSSILDSVMPMKADGSCFSDADSGL